MVCESVYILFRISVSGFLVHRLLSGDTMAVSVLDRILLVQDIGAGKLAELFERIPHETFGSIGETFSGDLFTASADNLRRIVCVVWDST